MFAAFMIVVMLCRNSAGLQCFQCSATSDESPCVSDASVLVNTKNHGGPFSKNCTIERDQRFCLIESSHSRGHLTTFVRDCSDGETFSFDSIGRLQHIAPTNQTTCATFGTSGTVVCITLCSTDFCNGPQTASAVSGEQHISRTLFLLLICYSIFLIS